MNYRVCLWQFYLLILTHLRGMDIKKEYRCTPTFVNLKSNTMKNTLQRYELFGILANYPKEKVCFITLISQNDF